MIPTGLLLLGLSACQPTKPASTATLIYTAHWDGEIEPCG